LASSALLFVAARAIHRGETMAGAVSPLAGGDQFRYFAWTRQAGDHLLFGNEFGPGDEGRSLLHPMFVLSGLAWRAGASVQLAYFLWMPLAIAVLWWGYAAYVRHTVEAGPGARLATLALALLSFTPLLPLLDWSGTVGALTANQLVAVAGPISPYWQLWGYFPAAVGLGLMPVFLLLAQRIVEGPAGWSRAMPLCGACGLTVSWVHPWGGVTLLLIVAGFVSWDRFARRSLALLVPAALTSAPLVYYLVLSLNSDAWQLGRLQAIFFADRPLWVLLVAVAPLGLLAAAGLGSLSTASVRDRLLVLWPVAAAVGYVVVGQRARLLVLEGLSLPLAVLAARAALRWRLPRTVSVAAVAALTLPGMVYSLQSLRDTARGGTVPYGLTADEARALRALDRDGASGDVLASSYISVAVPGLAGRQTFVGSPSEVAAAQQRAIEANRFFDGDMRPGAMRDLLRRTRARFVLAECQRRGRLDRVLRAERFVLRRIGCVRLYERSSTSL
jgi:hypothetical protein